MTPTETKDGMVEIADPARHFKSSEHSTGHQVQSGARLLHVTKKIAV